MVYNIGLYTGSALFLAPTYFLMQRKVLWVLAAYFPMRVMLASAFSLIGKLWSSVIFDSPPWSSVLGVQALLHIPILIFITLFQTLSCFALWILNCFLKAFCSILQKPSAVLMLSNPSHLPDLIVSSITGTV